MAGIDRKDDCNSIQRRLIYQSSRLSHQSAFFSVSLVWVWIDGVIVGDDGGYGENDRDSHEVRARLNNQSVCNLVNIWIDGRSGLFRGFMTIQAGAYDC